MVVSLETSDSSKHPKGSDVQVHPPMSGLVTLDIALQILLRLSGARGPAYLL
jgi:hypothetical protein